MNDFKQKIIVLHLDCTYQGDGDFGHFKDIVSELSKDDTLRMHVVINIDSKNLAGFELKVHDFLKTLIQKTQPKITFYYFQPTSSPQEDQEDVVSFLKKHELEKVYKQCTACFFISAAFTLKLQDYIPKDKPIIYNRTRRSWS